jgi:hypothetical protein
MEFDEGEFQRWLSESVWFPTNLLPSEHLKWTEIDQHSAKLSFHYNESSIEFVVTINDLGEIEQMETKRFMQKGSKEIWIVKFADYKKMNGVFIPTRNEAFWRLEGNDFCYARFNLLDFEIISILRNLFSKILTIKFINLINDYGFLSYLQHA